jgi:hypothetical protein
MILAMINALMFMSFDYRREGSLMNTFASALAKFHDILQSYVSQRIFSNRFFLHSTLSHSLHLDQSNKA